MMVLRPTVLIAFLALVPHISASALSDLYGIPTTESNAPGLAVQGELSQDVGMAAEIQPVGFPTVPAASGPLANYPDGSAATVNQADEVATLTAYQDAIMKRYQEASIANPALLAQATLPSSSAFEPTADQVALSMPQPSGKAMAMPELQTPDASLAIVAEAMPTTADPALLGKYDLPFSMTGGAPIATPSGTAFLPPNTDVTQETPSSADSHTEGQHDAPTGDFPLPLLSPVSPLDPALSAGGPTISASAGEDAIQMGDAVLTSIQSTLTALPPTLAATVTEVPAALLTAIPETVSTTMSSVPAIVDAAMAIPSALATSASAMPDAIMGSASVLQKVAQDTASAVPGAGLAESPSLVPQLPTGTDILAAGNLVSPEGPTPGILEAVAVGLDPIQSAFPVPLAHAGVESEVSKQPEAAAPAASSIPGMVLPPGIQEAIASNLQAIPVAISGGISDLSGTVATLIPASVFGNPQPAGVAAAPTPAASMRSQPRLVAVPAIARSPAAADALASAINASLSRMDSTVAALRTGVSTTVPSLLNGMVPAVPRASRTHLPGSELSSASEPLSGAKPEGASDPAASIPEVASGDVPAAGLKTAQVEGGAAPAAALPELNITNLASIPNAIAGSISDLGSTVATILPLSVFGNQEPLAAAPKTSRAEASPVRAPSSAPALIPASITGMFPSLGSMLASMLPATALGSAAPAGGPDAASPAAGPETKPNDLASTISGLSSAINQSISSAIGASGPLLATTVTAVQNSVAVLADGPAAAGPLPSVLGGAGLSALASALPSAGPAAGAVAQHQSNTPAAWNFPASLGIPNLLNRPSTAAAATPAAAPEQGLAASLDSTLAALNASSPLLVGAVGGTVDAVRASTAAAQDAISTALNTTDFELPLAAFNWTQTLLEPALAGLAGAIAPAVSALAQAASAPLPFSLSTPLLSPIPIEPASPRVAGNSPVATTNPAASSDVLRDIARSAFAVAEGESAEPAAVPAAAPVALALADLPAAAERTVSSIALLNAGVGPAGVPGDSTMAGLSASAERVISSLSDSSPLLGSAAAGSMEALRASAETTQDAVRLVYNTTDYELPMATLNWTQSLLQPAYVGLTGALAQVASAPLESRIPFQPLIAPRRPSVAASPIPATTADAVAPATVQSVPLRWSAGIPQYRPQSFRTIPDAAAPDMASTESKIHATTSASSAADIISANADLQLLPPENQEIIVRALEGGRQQDDGGLANQVATARYIVTDGCSDKGFGTFPDPSNPKAFYFCLGFGSLGIELYCAWNSCFRPGIFIFPLGYCGNCPTQPPPVPPSPSIYPPPPPQPISCPLPDVGPSSNACGAESDVITVYDLLGGGCGWGPSLLPQTPFACTTQIFGRNCPGFRGNLFLAFLGGSGSTGVPNMQSYLDTLGLGSVDYLGSLTVFAGSISVPIAPTFLSTLISTGFGLTVTTEANSTGGFTELPGLENVQQIGSNLLLGDFNSLKGPLFDDLSSFSGLRCLGGGLGLYNSPLMVSTEGLENLARVSYKGQITTGPRVRIEGTGISTPQGLAPLSLAFNCTSGTPFEVNVTLSSCPTRFVDTTTACGYISSGTC
eukprot:jgi/Botrbrau1/9534/Bobra.0211s0025.2